MAGLWVEFEGKKFTASLKKEREAKKDHRIATAEGSFSVLVLQVFCLGTSFISRKRIASKFRFQIFLQTVECLLE